jgi:hypothetical membrane protein
MNIRQLIHDFHKALPWVGPSLWVCTVQNFAAVAYVSLAFEGGYDWAHNHISDLGNTACGWYRGRYVCSPHHGVINLSYIALGAAMIVGALIIYQEFRYNRGAIIGFSSIAIAGLGAILIGIFPENTVHWVHLLGSAMVFGIGNLAIITLGLSLKLPKWLHIYSVASGVIALTAVGLFITHTYLGLGYGTLEHTATDSETIWMIVIGSQMLASE